MSVRRKFSDYEKNFVYGKYNGTCSICGKPVSKNKMAISHEIPLSVGGTNEFSNLMLTCRDCSLMKHDMLTGDFFEKVKEVCRYNHITIEGRE